MSSTTNKRPRVSDSSQPQRSHASATSAAIETAPPVAPATKRMALGDDIAAVSAGRKPSTRVVFAAVKEISTPLLGLAFFSPFASCADAVNIRATCRKLRDIAKENWGDVMLRNRTVSVETFQTVACCFPNTRTLDLRWSILREKPTRETLAKFHHLEELLLTGCTGIVDADLALIACLPHLRRLQLPRTPITHTGLVHLKAAPNLRVLDMSVCSNLADEACVCLTTFPVLESIDLSCCSQLSWVALASLGSCRSLVSLDVSNCQVNDKVLLKISKMKTLRKLSCAFSPMVTDTGVRYLAENDTAVSLTSLSLRNCMSITSAAVTAMTLPSQSSTHSLSASLQELDMSYCSNVTDEGFIQIAQFSQMKVLRLESNNTITVKAVLALSALKHLRKLDLSLCDALIVNKEDSRCYLLEAKNYLTTLFNQHVLITM